MPAETTFVKAKYAVATDEVKAFPTEVSAPGAKSFDKYLEEHTLTVKGYSGSATLKSGELALQEKTGETFTLPAVGTANQIIGVWYELNSGTVKITASGGALIYGDFITGPATITLAAYQHVLLQSNGSNWLIIAGEPKRTAVYEALKVYVSGEELEPSATRDALVTFTVEAVLEHACRAEITVGGVLIGTIGAYSPLADGTSNCALQFRVPAGVKWKAVTALKPIAPRYTFMLL